LTPVSGEEAPDALDRSIAEMYRGSLEDFVRRRDALTKELRAAGNREAAATVKGLRKPSRTAWALNLAAQEAPDAIEAVVAAVQETAGSQTAGGDVRAAIGGLRAAVREMASCAAAEAERAGQRMEAVALGNALFAVLGDAESFDLLRRGRLADVPEAGGLYLLTTLLAPVDRGPRATPTAVASAPAKAATPAPADSQDERAALQAAARKAVQEAASLLATARERSSAAGKDLTAADSKLQAAEAQLRKAEEEARTARAQRDRARQDAEAAAAHLLDAESAAAEAARRLSAVGSGGA
jgi:hypothetical protein